MVVAEKCLVSLMIVVSVTCLWLESPNEPSRQVVTNRGGATGNIPKHGNVVYRPLSMAIIVASSAPHWSKEHDMNATKPGKRIHAARLAKGYGLRECARLTGMSPSALASLESGGSNLPSLEKAIKLAAVLDKTVGWIVDGEDNRGAVTKEQQELLDATTALSPHAVASLIAMIKALTGR